MEEPKKNLRSAFHWKSLLQNFLQGMVIIAPLAITVYAVILVFKTIDNILPNIIHSIIPTLIPANADGSIKTMPGIGFVVVVAFVILIGKISSSFIITKLIDVMDYILERTPGIKFIYSSIKELLEAFAGNKKKFTKPVLVNVDSADIWRVGFITQQDADNFDLPGYAVVYVPLSYTITGITYIVPQKNIKPLENISPGDAMKFAVSGGVTEVD